MGPIFSIVIAIFSLMPAIIFVIVFKVLLTILKRGKSKMTEDFYENEKKIANSKNIYKNRSSDQESLIDEIKRVIKEEKEKDKIKKESSDKKIRDTYKDKVNKYKHNNKKDKIFINKDINISQRELKEKLLEKKSLSRDKFESSKVKENKEVLEGSKNLETMSDKIFESEFIKECESDYVNYEDNNSCNDFSQILNFDEDDLLKIQIYKEIFDKPLSLR
ncbi:hypothetical protein [Peptoniphilus timonensis]|uniref:hypothetical protein n=1 Tax=Peptoniphilus timonensis TaxID=1268254 RepID=UPI0002FE194C|nr:hypothetical protein [Peptoniphilus timonensis]